MTLLPPDFSDFLRLLHAHGVEYLLIGGYAVGYYGYPRATADMDLWIALHPDNADKMCAVMRAFGMELTGETTALFQQKDKVIRMGVPPLRLEILTSISGVAFADCYAARQTVQIDGVEVSLIGLDDLRKNKAASGRHKDLDDLDHLQSGGR